MEILSPSLQEVEESRTLQALPAELGDGWRREKIQLRFDAGELPLFHVGLSALVSEDRLNLSAAAVPPQLMPAAAFPPDVEVIVRHSWPVAAGVPTLAVRGGTLRYVLDRYCRFYVDLSGTMEEYWRGSLSAKSRSTIGRKVRRFADFSGGAIDWREFRTAPEIEEFRQLASAVSARTYQERLHGTGLPQSTDFVARLAEWAARDRVRGYILFHQGRPIAYLLCPARGDVLCAQYLGYDPAFRSCSPGTVLQYVVLERLFSDGRFALFDFTKGEGQHKEVFASHGISCADLYDFRLSARTAVVVALHVGISATVRVGGDVMHSVGLRSRARRMVRAIATSWPWPRADSAREGSRPDAIP